MPMPVFIPILLFATSQLFGIEDPPAWWKAESNQTDAHFGWSVSSGDFNGDGYDDMIAGAKYYGSGEYNEGMVFIWYGEEDIGLGEDGNPTNAHWEAKSSQEGARLGWSVGSGDFNGDGYDDVIIGSPYYDDGEENEGMVFVWYGDSTGLGSDGIPTNADWKAESNQGWSFLGYSVGSGDFNGDGYDDVIVGAYIYENGANNEGMVFVWYGSLSGLGLDGTPTNADWKAESNQENAEFGISVSSGDFNGNGYDDVIVGAKRYDNGEEDEGMVFVWYGDSTGLGLDGTPTNADWKAESNQARAHLGNAVGSGDFDGDGYADLLTGAYWYGASTEGIVFVWYGSDIGLGADGNPTNAGWKAESNQASAFLGISVSSGDFNGDGYEDVITGAHHYANGQDKEGTAFVWCGSSTGLGSDGNPTNADWNAESNQEDARFGYSVGSGDFDGDGYDDMVAGAYLYDNLETNEGMVFAWYGEPEPGVEESTKCKVQNAKLTVCPNPFINKTVISYWLLVNSQKSSNYEPSTMNHELRIYDLSGRLVKTYEVTTKSNTIGENLKSGIYFLKVDGYKPVKVVKLR